MYFKNLQYMENAERITLLKDKILQHINNSTMDISSELQIFEAILKKYDMKTITNYGNYQNPKLTYNGVLDRISRDKYAYFKIDKIIFVCM
jgi:hypothetical protein